MNVGLIGCGAIGCTLAQAIVEGKAGETRLRAICDLSSEAIDRVKAVVSLPDLFCTTVSDDLINHPDVDFVIEAASQAAVRGVAEKVLRAGKSLLIMSAGALRDNALTRRVEGLARAKGVKVYLPSGAICGLDGVKAATVEEVTRAEIITTKHPRALEGAPYLAEHEIQLGNLTSPTTIYRGPARDAARWFPENVNVAVALSLAGIGVDHTMVTLIADPEATRTRHEVTVTGAFGELQTVVMNHVHPANPKTSYLAALAAIRTLRKLTEPIQIGT